MLVLQSNNLQPWEQRGLVFRQTFEGLRASIAVDDISAKQQWAFYGFSNSVTGGVVRNRFGTVGAALRRQAAAATVSQQGPQNGLTVSGWFRTGDVTNGAGGFNIWSGANPDARFLSFAPFDSSGKWSMSFNDGGAGSNYFGRNTGSFLVNERWFHMVGVWDGTLASSGIAIYANGVRVDTTDANSGTVAAVVTTSIRPTINAVWSDQAAETIGQNNFSDSADVRLYNRPFSPAEVLMLYAQQFQPIAGIETIALEQAAKIWRTFAQSYDMVVRRPRMVPGF